MPDYNSMVEKLDRCVSLLENEDSGYRPKEKSEKKYSGGLICFNNENSQKPVIVIPDIHARADFLLNVLKLNIEAGNEKMSVLQALEKDLIYVVCAGDLFHSELRGFNRWRKAFAEYKSGDILSTSMQEEMKENLAVLQIVMDLKLAFPAGFHVLKGNHENVLNEEGHGNHPFYKMAAEGEMFYSFLREQYDDALIYLWSCFEHSLPVCAVFKNLVVSHAEPAFNMNKTKIINYRKHPEVILGLTWTDNGQAKTSSVSKTIKSLVNKNCRDVIWIGGHRPVNGKYALRQRGKYIQLHNPNEQNIAFVVPDRKFNPETDITSVTGED